MACCCTKQLKAVPVSNNVKSSDLFTPNQPVRITQKNIGQYFVPDDPLKVGPINEYGYPSSPPLKSRDRPPHIGNPPPCPEKHGQYDSIVPPPGKDAHYIHQLHQRNKTIQNPLSTKKQFFPRARGFEMHGFDEKITARTTDSDEEPAQYVQDQYQYSPETRLHLDCPPSYRAETLNPYFYNPVSNWYPEPQFWYFGNPQPLKPTWPVANPDDYTFQKLPYPSEEVTLFERMEVERPERYLPGEIYRNEPEKRPIEDLSKQANCSLTWRPKDPTFFDQFKPDQAMMNGPKFLDQVLEWKRGNQQRKRPCERKEAFRCVGVEDKQTKERNEKDPNARIDSIEVGPCLETCDFGPDPAPKPDACDLTRRKSKLPLGVMRKILPHIDEQLYLEHNEVSEKADGRCKGKRSDAEKKMIEDALKERDKSKAPGRQDTPRSMKPRVPCAPLEPGFSRYDPSTERACQLAKVGQTFKSDAINQHSCINPPPGFVPVHKEGKRQFPDFGLSHI